MQLDIKKLQAHELETFKQLIWLFEDVFNMENFTIPADAHLQKLLKKESFFVFVALQAGEVVGGLTCFTLDQYYSEKQLVYIFDLAIKTELQRKGIGKKLIISLTDYCREQGIQEVFVQADEVDDYALDFYRSTGGTAEKVVHFTYPLNMD